MKAVVLVIAASMLTGGAHAEDDVFVTESALRQCAAAGVAECQFKLAQQLAASHDGRGEAKRLYEQAYAAGYQDAGPALLSLVAQPPSAAPAPASTLAPDAPLAAGAPYSFDAVAVQHAKGSLIAQVRITNRSDSKLYVSRGNLRAFQNGHSIDISDGLKQSTGGKFLEFAGFLVGAAAEMAGGDIGLSGDALRDNVTSGLAESAADAVTDAGQSMYSSTAPQPYLASSYVEPGATLVALVQLQTRDASTPIQLELSAGDTAQQATIAPLAAK